MECEWHFTSFIRYISSIWPDADCKQVIFSNKRPRYINANHPNNNAHLGTAIIMKPNIEKDIAELIKELYLQAAAITVICDNTYVSIYPVCFPPRHNGKCYQILQFFGKLGNKFPVSNYFNTKHTWWGSPLINQDGWELHKCISQYQCSALLTGTSTHWAKDVNKVTDLPDFAVW